LCHAAYSSFNITASAINPSERAAITKIPLCGTQGNSDGKKPVWLQYLVEPLHFDCSQTADAQANNVRGARGDASCSAVENVAQLGKKPSRLPLPG
jgi:hypothetical protein